MDPRKTKRCHRSGADSGEFTLNSAFMLLFVMMLLVLAITVLGVVNTSMKLHSVAAELTRYIEIRGMVDSSAYAEMDRLADETGVTVERYTIQSATGSSQIQFGTSFTVTLETTGRFGIGGMLSVSVPLHSTVTGRSERYWK